MDLVICSVTKITASVIHDKLHLQLCVIVEGLYQVEVRLLGYENPTGRCQGCPFHNGFRSCCDSFNRNDRCTDGDRGCDSYFTYCLRPFGNQTSQDGGGCSDRDNSEIMTSQANENDGGVNFFQSTVLGLGNPFLFQGLTNNYMVSACLVLL